jgi:hypothetical protein
MSDTLFLDGHAQKGFIRAKLEIMTAIILVVSSVLLYHHGSFFWLFDYLGTLNSKLFGEIHYPQLENIANIIYEITFFAMLSAFWVLAIDTLPKLYVNFNYGQDLIPIKKTSIQLLIILPITIIFCNLITTAFILIFYYIFVRIKMKQKAL